MNRHKLYVLWEINFGNLPKTSNSKKIIIFLLFEVLEIKIWKRNHCLKF